MRTVFTRKIPVQDTWKLRHKILRPNQPFESVQFSEDKQLGATHFGAYLVTNPEKPARDPQLIGILSLYKENISYKELDPSFTLTIGWRIRGMAVEESFRQLNVGAVLLNACYEFIKQTTFSGVWCNARASVTKFYEKNGFKIISDEFEIPNIGPHYLMVNEKPLVRKIETKNCFLIQDPGEDLV